MLRLKVSISTHGRSLAACVDIDTGVGFGSAMTQKRHRAVRPEACQVRTATQEPLALSIMGRTANRNVSTGTNPSTFDNSYEVADNFERFGILVSNLEAGDYTIALNALTSTSITRAVPEPGSLALIGLAFLGLGFGASRRQNKQG